MMYLVDKLIHNHSLTKEEYIELLKNWHDPVIKDRLKNEAQFLRSQYYGYGIYVRGLIEFTNICKNNCYYCGIRRDNRNVTRYRLTKEEILECCDYGYELGFRTFVLQGGEDGYFTDEIMTDLISSIKKAHPDCALTLSVGEKSYETYEAYKNAGADRYLLRHETACEAHYNTLHPEEMKLSKRIRCLKDLKSLGFQTGAGFMVGSPNQTMETIADDLVFLQDLKPEMVGIGPFIPHHDTCFAKEPAGSVDFTLFLLSIIRIILPKVLLPATTALGTMDEMGREKGILHGANVIMPNLSPLNKRKQYELYDNKICTGEEAAEGLASLEERLRKIGCHIVYERGDYPNE